MFRTTAGVAAIALVSLAACDDPVSPPVPAVMEVHSGNGQDTLMGSPLSQPLRVVVRDGRSRPVSGAWVRWSLAEGSGELSADSSRTDSAGMASARLTLGSVAGPYQVTARHGSLPPVHFSGRAQTHCEARVVRGLRFTEAVPAVLTHDSVAVRVQVLCDDATPLAGTQVEWAVVTGSAAPAVPSSPTDGAGFASVWLRMGAAPGPVAVRATAGAFTAELATEALDRCAPRAELRSGDTLAGVVRPVDCDRDPGIYGTSRYVVHRLEVTEQELIRLEITWVGYRLSLWNHDGTRLLAASSGEMNIELVPGSYLLQVAADAGAEPGASYAVSRRTILEAPCPPYPATAATVWLLPGTTVTHAITADNCGYWLADPGRWDRYHVQLRAGETLRVSLSSDVLEPELLLGVQANGGTTIIQWFYPEGGVSVGELVATEDRTYIIIASTRDDRVGSYTLELR
jgi:hypothetical protein